MPHRFVLAVLVMIAAIPAPVFAQQGQGEWFVPGGQRPAGQPAPQGQPRPPQQRPPQQPQRPQPAALAPGQQPPAPVIGIVDVQEVQRLSSALTQIREEMERRRARLNEDVQREQGRWREEQQRLATDRATLTADQIRQRERDLQDRITNAQSSFRDRQRNNDQIGQQALGEIEQALVVVIRQVATSRNVNLVLQRPIVILSEPPFDLTEEVAAQLNRAITRVTLPAEDAAPAAAPTTTPAAPARPATAPRTPPQR